jgi:hypothetical protein
MNEPQPWTNQYDETALKHIANLADTAQIGSIVYKAAVEAQAELDRRHTELHEADQRDLFAGNDGTVRE